MSHHNKTVKDHGGDGGGGGAADKVRFILYFEGKANRFCWKTGYV